MLDSFYNDMNRHILLKNNVRYYRTLKHLTQSDLANLCNVSKNTISSIETGKLSCSAYLAYLLCLKLGVPFEQLFYF